MTENIMDLGRHQMKNIVQGQADQYEQGRKKQRGSHRLPPFPTLRQVEPQVAADDIERQRTQKTRKEDIQMFKDQKSQGQYDDQDDDLTDPVIELLCHDV